MYIKESLQRAAYIEMMCGLLDQDRNLFPDKITTGTNAESFAELMVGFLDQGRNLFP
jgi:hypothetical protein